MFKTTSLLAAVAVAAMTSVASAAVTGTWSAGTDVGGGLTKYVLHVTSTVPGELIGGFDINISTPMSQQNPFGFITVFQDNNGLMVPAALDVNKDSQILFNTAAGADILVAPGTAAEGAALLKAAFVIPATSAYDPAQEFDLLQLVVTTGSQLPTQIGQASISGPGGAVYEITFGEIPEPASLGLMSLGALALLRRKH